MTQKDTIQTELDKALADRDAAVIRKTQLREELAALWERIEHAGIDTDPRELAAWLSLAAAYDVLLSKTGAVIEAAKQEVQAQKDRLSGLNGKIGRVQAELQKINEQIARYPKKHTGAAALSQQLDKLRAQLAELGGASD